MMEEVKKQEERKGGEEEWPSVNEGKELGGIIEGRRDKEREGIGS